MTARTQKEKSDSYKDDVPRKNNLITPDEVHDHLCKLVDGVHRDTLKLHSLNPYRMKHEHRSQYIKNILKYYTETYNSWQELDATEKKIFDIEEKGHFQTLRYRGLTTLLVGFLIMFLYGVAGLMSIQMPLRFY